jgi:hypothetical protein
LAPIDGGRAAEKGNRDPSLRSEDVTKLRKGDFSHLNSLFSALFFCVKTKNSQPVRMTSSALFGFLHGFEVGFEGGAVLFLGF